MNPDLSNLGHVRNELVDLAIRFGPKLVVAILILLAGSMVARWVGQGSERALARIDLEPPVRLLLVRVVRGLVIGLFAIIALQNLGVELLPLIAGLSVVGAGVALATQGVLSNLVAGLNIIFSKPFRVGDYIEIVGVQGQVEQISLFSTTLVHADMSRVVVPNRKIVGEILHNYQKIRQVEVNVGIGYETDLAQALVAIRDIVVGDPRVLRDPAPVVAIAALGDSAVQIAVRPWVSVADYAATGGDLYSALLATCRARGISIPYPQREVRLIGRD
jgi:small conductance mechanosensitive channel